MVAELEVLKQESSVEDKGSKSRSRSPEKIVSPYKQGQVANPFSEVQELWDERRPTI